MTVIEWYFIINIVVALILMLTTNICSKAAEDTFNTGLFKTRQSAAVVSWIIMFITGAIFLIPIFLHAAFSFLLSYKGNK